MTTLPRLVSALTLVDSRDHASIEHIARLLREEGWIPNGKRGGGAPAMDAIAGANLLIALNAADVPRDAPMAVSIVRFLEQSGFVDDERYPEAFRAIGASATFGDALKLAIEFAPEIYEAMKQFIDDAYSPDVREHQKIDVLRGRSAIKFVVEIERTFARMAFIARGFKIETQWEARFYLNLPGVSDKHARDYIGKLWDSDRSVLSRFGIPTLLHVSSVLDGSESPVAAIKEHS